jgi:hypothetical protein
MRRDESGAKKGIKQEYFAPYGCYDSSLLLVTEQHLAQRARTLFRFIFCKDYALLSGSSNRFFNKLN